MTRPEGVLWRCGRQELLQAIVRQLALRLGGDAQCALLGRDAGVGAEQPAEVAEVGKAAADGGFGDAGAALQHGDGNVEPDAGQAGIDRAAIHGMEARLQAFFVQAHGAGQGLHGPVLVIALLQKRASVDQVGSVSRHRQYNLLRCKVFTQEAGDGLERLGTQVQVA